MTPLEEPNSTQLATGEPQSGSAMPTENGGKRGIAGNHPFPSPCSTTSRRSNPKFPGKAGKGVLTAAARSLSGALSRSLAVSPGGGGVRVGVQVQETLPGKSLLRVGQRPFIQPFVMG